MFEFFPRDLLVDRETGQSRVLTNGCFEILGASIGDEAFCNAYTQDKTRTASSLLDKISQLDDPHVSTRLLRNCAGVCKITHNMRMVPTHLHANALANFDEEVRKTFCKTTGLLPDDGQWAQACLGFRHAGLGFRSAAHHGEAAYLASACASREKCRNLLPTFSLDGDMPASHFGLNLASFNAKLPADKDLTPQSIVGRSQKSMSEALDECTYNVRLQNVSLTDKAAIILEGQVVAKEFWQVVPNKSFGLAVPGEESIREVRRHFCMLESPADDWCPMLDQVLDAYGHHAKICCAGGDMTRRHNATRNEGFHFAKAAGCNPKLEKSDLLLPKRPDDTSNSLRRPTDVYIPTWIHGLSAALDFAITAPQRQGIVDRAAATGLAAATEYCNTKRSHENTQAECEAAGVCFLPMMAETTGARALEPLDVWKQLAKATAVRQGRPVATLFTEMMQSLSVTIRSANARAFLRRSGA